ncbi:hypothetical protein ACFSL6_23525 [Paenibacillus thailandensis]|uniref:RNA polymerase sigma-70 region 2 domain-containing protein n=1 Tax=Paenibacillus thailandensis TaxID=393250 RepID=A0ABW5R459_9BACL
MEADQLAAAGIEGDEHALLQRIELDKRKMYGIAYAYLRNETDALEAIQETVCRGQQRHPFKPYGRGKPAVLHDPEGGLQTAAHI